MIAVDTNVLVHAHREESEWHAAAYGAVRGLAEGRSLWGIPWPCIHEFLAIVTHPRIFDPPSPLDRALGQVSAWLESPTLTLLCEAGDYWRHLERTLTESRVAGPKVHDARIAALCTLHGVTRLWSADRDFGRFPAVNVENPLVRNAG